MPFLKTKRRLVGSVGALWVVAVIFFTGTNRDYEADVRLLQRAFDGWLPINGFDGRGNYYTDFHPKEVVDSYGYTFHYLSYLIQRFSSFVFGFDFGLNSTGRIVVHNLVIAVVGLLACVVVGRMVGLLADSVKAEYGALLLLAFTPIWAGHSWVNQKDVPFATGFIICTLLAVSSQISPGNRLERMRLTTREQVTYGSIAVMLTFGTRPGIAVLVVPLLALALFDQRSLKPTNRPLMIGLLIGSIGTLLTNPAALPNPLSWLRSAIDVGRNFSGWNGDVFRFGRFIGGRKLGPTYLPFEYFTQLPLLVILGMLSVVAFALVGRDKRLRVLLPLAYHAVVIPVVVFGLSTNNYNSGRQYLFVVPIWVAIAAYGLCLLLNESGPNLRRVTFGLCCVLAVPLAIDHVTIFPYQYIYRNEVFRTIPNFENRFEFDYWGLAGRQVGRDVERSGASVVFVGRGATIPGDEYSARYTDANTILPFISRSIGSTNDMNGQYNAIAWLNYWPPPVDSVFRNGLRPCAEFSKVSVFLWPKRIALGAVYKC